MNSKTKLVGRSAQSPVENEVRKVVVLPGKKSTDFIITARCRIINVGARTSFSASDLPGEEAGTFSWSTNSTKIRIVNSSGPVVAIEALMEPSLGRDQETITVIRTSSSGSKTKKIVHATVARIKFGPAQKQSFGYDDYDKPAVAHDHHVSVGAADSTIIAVKIEGGAIGTDFDFVADDAAACTVGKIPGLPTFDLTIQAVTGEKKETILRAIAKCPSQPEFSRIFVNIYPKVTTQVLVAKVVDTKSAQTTLKYPAENYALHGEVANKKLREAVVEYRIENFDSKNAVTDIAYDSDLSGALTYDINNDGGKAFEVIKRTIANYTHKQRVVIVRGMKSYYYLSQPAKTGDTQITVKGDNIFTSDMVLGTGSSSEDVVVIKNAGNVGYLNSPLTKDHPSGEPLEFPAIGWGSDPIIICEGKSAEIVKWTIIHEVGHTALNLADVVDQKNLMHFSDNNSDYKLRHCARSCKYEVGVTENQWDAADRSQKSLGKV